MTNTSLPETYPGLQKISKMECFVTIVTCKKSRPFTIDAKRFILDVCQTPRIASQYITIKWEIAWEIQAHLTNDIKKVHIGRRTRTFYLHCWLYGLWIYGQGNILNKLNLINTYLNQMFHYYSNITVLRVIGEFQYFKSKSVDPGMEIKTEMPSLKTSLKSLLKSLSWFPLHINGNDT